MSKRADAIYIKTMSKILPIVIDWAYVPLFVLDKDTHVAKEADDIRKGLDITDEVFSSLMDDAAVYAPSQDFLFLDKTLEVSTESTLKHNYFYVSFKTEEGSPNYINILYPTQRDKLMWFAVMKEADGTYSARVMQAQGTKNEQWSMEGVESGHFDYKGDERRPDIERFLAALLVKMATTMRALGHSDLYAIEAKGKQHRKVHAKKPWQRSDLPSILYLNKLPTEYVKPKGGHHASPEPHPRSGAWRRLDNECFKHHPKYRDKI